MTETPHVIQSGQNPLVKQLRTLGTARGIREHRQGIVCGERLVREAAARHPDRCRMWIRPTGDDRMPPAGLDVRHLEVLPEIFRDLDSLGTRHPLLVVEVPPMPAWNPKAGLADGLTVFVPFQDPENVGAVIRSAVAFGTDRVILLAESAHPFHPKAIRASGGAVLDARLLVGPSLNDLPLELPLVPLSNHGRPIETFRFPDPCGLLPGLEGPGLPEAWRPRAVRIPIAREVESLNAAASVAVALYARARSRDRKA